MPPVVRIFEAHDYPQQIARAADLLQAGGLVVVPTETVYGAAALLNADGAAAKLRKLRGGESDKAFVVHLAHPRDAERYLGSISELGRRMIGKLWPGPVALEFQVPSDRQQQIAESFKLNVSDLFQDGWVTLRCPDHPIFSDVTERLNGPIGITATADLARVDDAVELVLDAGPTVFSKPSTIVRVNDDSYEVVREGVYDRRIIERLLRTTILFVCSGNTCRSPMAEALARKALSAKFQVQPNQLEDKGVVVMSAGSFAMPGSRATPQAVEAVRELGADLSGHRSRPLSVELIHQADHIFTMGRSHQQAVQALVPAAREKTTTLNPAGDIEDPIGGDTALYLSLAKVLDELIDQNVVSKVGGGQR